MATRSDCICPNAAEEKYGQSIQDFLQLPKWKLSNLTKFDAGHGNLRKHIQDRKSGVYCELPRRVCALQNQTMTLREKAEAADFFHLHRYLRNDEEILPIQLLGFAQMKFVPSELTALLCALKIAQNPDNLRG